MAEWLAGGREFKVSICSLHAALCLRGGQCTPPAPEPGAVADVDRHQLVME